MKHFLIIVFSLLMHSLFSQSHLIKKIELQVSDIFSDGQSSFYVLSNNILTAYNEDSEETGNRTSDSGDIITSVDVKNPFKILVFYGHINSFRLLDRDLVPVSDEISSEDFGVFGECLLIRSDRGGYLLWDEDNSELIKLNSDFEKEYTNFLRFDDPIIQLMNRKSELLFRTEKGNLFIYNTEKSELTRLVFVSNNPIFLYNDQFCCFDEKLQSFFVLQESEFGPMSLSLEFPVGSQFKNALCLNEIVVCYDEEFLYCYRMIKDQ